MEKIATIGLDIAKSVFQVHGIDAAGEVVVRTRLLPSGRQMKISVFLKGRTLLGRKARKASRTDR
ncbi:MAG: hypothetical protein LCH74_04995 [Proteobacteria bacterium]|jgi:hypothetical protein|uniref:hypothetical protein n=1 Tax=Sphingopyxis sp. QXT-31 TaxID=1357916 RepID=UPI0012EC9A75|nr:hypothetical protein [Sphingopyxis sp. QXT-31]MCA0208394.1 hypothetical protein [Pseudomonadota bacterium]